MKISWEEIIHKIFKDKKQLIQEVLKSTTFFKYDDKLQKLYIGVDKVYIERLLILKVLIIKDTFKILFDAELNSIKINKSTFDFSAIKQEENIENIEISDLIVNPIAYKTAEEKLTNIESNKNQQKYKITLLFYNKFLYSTKKIELSIQQIDVKRDLYLSLWLFWTVIFPLFFIIRIIKNKIQRKLNLKKLNELKKLKYIPSNEETKNFIEFYLP